MNARLKPISLTEPSEDVLSFDEGAAPLPAYAPFLAAAFAFLCFMPYPAIPFGNYTAIQAGNIATLAALFFASFGLWRRVPVDVALLAIIPIVSTLKVALIDGGDASICFKTSASSALSLLTLLVVQMRAPRYGLSMLTGIAVAMLVHVAVGALQLYSFQSAVFPLADLYVNPSFLSVQDNAEIIARWIQRPFGLFPEPSAMSSSLAPFVICFMAILLDIVRLRTPPARWQRALFAVAAAGSLALIIVSRSGHAAPTLAAVLLLTVIWMLRAKATARTYLIIVAMFCLVLPIVLSFAVDALGDRVAGGASMGNASWEERSNSLMIGFRLWTGRDMATVLLGLGPGLTSVAIADASGIMAVFSIVCTYIYDSGLLGLLVIIWIARHIFITWRESRFNVVYAAITALWIIGVTFTTSYNQLLPIWITLGLLNCWHEVFEVPLPRPATLRASSQPSRLRRAATWLSPWAPMGAPLGTPSTGKE